MLNSVSRVLFVTLLAGGLAACGPAGHMEKRQTITEFQREQAAKRAAAAAATPKPEEETPEVAVPDVEPEVAPAKGEGPTLDLKKITDACRGGDARACLTLGMIKDQGVGLVPDAKAAASLYRRACDGGEQLACYNLGYLLENGRGVEMDTAEAAKLYEAACDAGEARACSNLGYILELGDGIPEDPDRAAALYRKACKGGAMVGCNNLGVAYEEGLILEPDVVRARDLYRRSCDGGHVRACTRLAGLHARGCFAAEGPEGACQPAPDDEAQLAAMIEATCEEAGTPIACAAAGVWLLGKAPNDPKIIERLEKACDNDEPWGCNSLATIFRVGGAGQESDGEKAEVLNDLACDKGFLPACRDLGAMYLNGDGVERDEARGLALVKKSCREDATTFCPDLLFFCAMGLDGACE